MVDFIKQVEEPQARVVAEDQRRAAEARAQAAAATRVDTATATSPAHETVPPVADLRDGVNAVNTDTGAVNSENAPTDPNLNANPQAEQAEEQQGEQSASQTEHEPQTVLTSAKAFEKKKESFFGLDTDKGFWSTLDGKLKEVGQIRTPEDMVNLAFIPLEFLFEMVSNWADHARKDAKTRKKAYEEAVAAHDHDMGVTPLHKNMAVWAAIADHPAMRRFQNQPITSEMVQAAYQVYRTDKTAQNAAIAILQSMTGREFTKDDANKAFENAFKAKLGGNSLQDIKGLALNDEKIYRAIDLSGAKDQIYGMHQRNQGFQAQTEQLNADRATLRTAQQQRQATGAHVRSGERQMS